MKGRIIKTFENYSIEDLDLGRFEHIIERDNLIPNLDGTYDYKGNLNFNREGLESLKEIPIKFKNVSGFYYCSDNQLISLEGAPLEVGVDFLCWGNDLISLQYAPLKVGGKFSCYNNRLMSEVHRSKIGGEFYSANNSFDDIDIDVIHTVKRMTHEQQISELQFFQLYDKDAYDKLLKILDDLGVDVEYRKEMNTTIKNSDNLKIFI